MFLWHFQPCMLVSLYVVFGEFSTAIPRSIWHEQATRGMKKVIPGTEERFPTLFAEKKKKFPPTYYRLVRYNKSIGIKTKRSAGWRLSIGDSRDRDMV